VHSDEVCIGRSDKTSPCVLPEIRISEIFTGEERGRTISIVDGKLHCASTVHVLGFVHGMKLVPSVWLNQHQLGNPGVRDSSAIDGDAKRSRTGASLICVQGYGDAVNPLVYPIEPSVQNV
jgi:hypothetical protein